MKRFLSTALLLVMASVFVRSQIQLERPNLPKAAEEPKTTAPSPQNSPKPKPKKQSAAELNYITYDGVEYEVWDHAARTLLLLDGKSYAGDLVIPSTITKNGKTYTVTEIAPQAFRGNTRLTSVTIPATVTELSNTAFYECTALKSVKLPESISAIRQWTFEGCSSLISVSLPSRLQKIEQQAFYRCSSLRDIVIPESVTSIGNYAFAECSSLGSIALPSSLMEIGVGLFDKCSSLRNVKIPNNKLKNIFAIHAIFRNCPIDDLDIDCNELLLYEFSDIQTIKNLTLGPNISKVNEDSFGKSPVENLVIRCTEVGDWLKYFTAVRNMTFESSVKDIKLGRFEAFNFKDYDWKIEKLTVNTPALHNLFSEVESIKTVVFGPAVTIVPARSFEGCYGIVSVSLPDNLQQIDQYAFNSCGNLESITIPNSVQTIGDYAFGNCVSLKSVKLPDSIKSIAKGTFYNCKDLSSVFLPNSITEIGEKAFENCSSLTSVKIPDSIRIIKANAFIYCSGLTSVTIPPTIYTIEPGAFASCRNLTEATVPSEFKKKKKEIFPNCDRLKNITYL